MSVLKGNNVQLLRPTKERTQTERFIGARDSVVGQERKLRARILARRDDGFWGEFVLDGNE